MGQRFVGALLYARAYAVIQTQDPETPSAHSHKSAQDHADEILSTSTIYIPSTDVSVSHEILVAVARYARELEDKVAALETELHTLIRRSPPLIHSTPDLIVSGTSPGNSGFSSSPSKAPSVMFISGQFRRRALAGGVDSPTPNPSMSVGHPLPVQETEPLFPIPPQHQGLPDPPSQPQYVYSGIEPYYRSFNLSHDRSRDLSGYTEGMGGIYQGTYFHRR
ncbi:hypothetical protein DFH08DRAFT_977244 [Mycena albidolilacea]|uniref:Uncharacterized protein n=1 Tax=Mycena albidolilacea TaxID=1033008 RepID=A0AAD6Z175_9AGAR|nr:hypothetical protein DFH08DRAFT_977244 [Mycena albidolilacea]